MKKESHKRLKESHYAGKALRAIRTEEKVNGSPPYLWLWRREPTKESLLRLLVRTWLRSFYVRLWTIFTFKGDSELDALAVSQQGFPGMLGWWRLWKLICVNSALATNLFSVSFVYTSTGVRRLSMSSIRGHRWGKQEPKEVSQFQVLWIK